MTNRRLLFIDHGLNGWLAVKPDEESISLKDISKINTKTVIFISKRLIVEKKNSSKQEYVVWNLDKWRKALKEALPQVEIS